MKTISKFRVLPLVCMFVFLLACKKDKKEADPTTVGKWNLTTRIYQDSSTPVQTEDFKSKGYYIDLKENLSYSVLFAGESGSGNYVLKNNTISFTIVTGDDDLTDEDTYAIKTLSNTALILEAKDAGSTLELRFTR